MNRLLLLPLAGVMLTACSQGTNEKAIDSAAADETSVGEQAIAVKTNAVEVPSNLKLRDDKLIPDQVKKKEAAQTGLLTGELQVTRADGLNVTLLITNNQAYGVQIQYRSGMTADLQILDLQGERVWAWSDDMMFTQALRDSAIASGQVIKVKFAVPESVLSNLKGRGYSLLGIYAGRATESDTIAMSDISLSLDPYIR